MPGGLLRDLGCADLARCLADQYREKVESYAQVELKLAYFQGALDWGHEVIDSVGS